MALVLPYPDLDTIPFLCDLAEHLASRGHAIDIFGSEEMVRKAPHFSSDRIRVRTRPQAFGRRSGFSTPQQSPADMATCRSGQRLRSRLRGVANRVLGVASPLDPWPVDRFPALRWRRHASSRYAVVVGVDPEGLVDAGAISDLTGAALGYYSLELLVSQDAQTRPLRALKQRERGLSRKAALVIAQDPDRAGVLIRDSGVDPDTVVYAPNAPSGPARRSPTRWWHERFDLPEDRRVLLHAGSVRTWTGLDGLVRAAAGLPENWVLVVHSNGREGQREEIEQLRRSAPTGKVFLSEVAVPRDEYRALVDGADAGLAFYIPEPGRWTMTNLRTLGLASGKVAYYLWCGLPVIANSLTSLGGLVERERIGVRVDTAEQLGDAVGALDRDRESLSSRAIEYFNATLDYADSARRIGDAIDRLASVPVSSPIHTAEASAADE